MQEDARVCCKVFSVFLSVNEDDRPLPKRYDCGERTAVDDYLDLCAETGKRPDRPYSGRIMLRVPPELHAQVAMQAELHGMSLNQWATERLANG